MHNILRISAPSIIRESAFRKRALFVVELHNSRLPFCCYEEYAVCTARCKIDVYVVGEVLRLKYRDSNSNIKPSVWGEATHPHPKRTKACVQCRDR